MGKAATVCAILFAASLFSQNTTIRTTVPLVVVSTSVTDKQGHPIYGLTASDFVLTDNGEIRSLNVEETDFGLAPVALVVVIQRTGVSEAALQKIKKVGAAIPEAVVGANGEAAVITFDDQVTVVQDFTSDADAITNAFRGLKASDSSNGRMIDAVEKALDLLAALPGPRRASILVIGESRDRGSETKLSDLLERMQRSGVTIYGLTYSTYLTPWTTKASDYSPPNGGGADYISGIRDLIRLSKRNTVEALTSETGGRQMKFETKSKLTNDLIALGTDIHSRYLLSFTPETGGPPSLHRLEVRIKSRPDAVVHAREEYWSGIR